MRSGTERLSVEADEHCAHCGERKQWKIVRHPTIKGRLFAYPLPCACPQKQAADEAERQHQADVEQASNEVLRQMAISRAGLVGRLADCTLDSFERRKDWPQAIECVIKVRRYWQAVYGEQVGHKPWLVLQGAYGTGKTHLAAAVIREAVLAGWNGAYFRSWTEYLGRLQASWDRERGEPRTNDLIDELKKGRIIAIDDIDKRESRSGWAQGELYAALNYRYNAKLPTILTFNCALMEPDPDPKAKGRMLLERYMGRALIDRVIESAFAIVEFDGPSYRSKVKW